MNNINNFTNNIPHRENYDNFVEVQSSQLMSVTNVDSYSPRDITQVQNDSVIVNYDHDTDLYSRINCLDLSS